MLVLEFKSLPTYYVRFLFIIILVIFAFSCKKPAVLPPEPVIEFVSVRTIDTVDSPELGNPVIYNKIKFSLVDGDGDIGNEAPNAEHNYNNTFLKIFKKENGIFSEHKIIVHYVVDDVPVADTIATEYRLPMVPIAGGQDKTLKAHVFLLIAIDLVKLPFDTLKYEVYVKDRAENISNIIETSEIIIPRD